MNYDKTEAFINTFKGGGDNDNAMMFNSEAFLDTFNAEKISDTRHNTCKKQSSITRSSNKNKNKYENISELCNNLSNNLNIMDEYITSNNNNNKNKRIRNEIYYNYNNNNNNNNHHASDADNEMDA
jgi:hypothetical protein